MDNPQFDLVRACLGYVRFKVNLADSSDAGDREAQKDRNGVSEGPEKTPQVLPEASDDVVDDVRHGVDVLRMLCVAMLCVCVCRCGRMCEGVQNVVLERKGLVWQPASPGGVIAMRSHHAPRLYALRIPPHHT
jgi:hypothetical protein